MPRLSKYLAVFALIAATTATSAPIRTIIRRP